MKRAQNQVGRDFVRIVKTYDGPAFGFASRNYYAQFLAGAGNCQQPNAVFTVRSTIPISVVQVHVKTSDR